MSSDLPDLIRQASNARVVQFECKAPERRTTGWVTELTCEYQRD
jgi:hypothetical protein